MAIYSRATVAHELDQAKAKLSGLVCDKETSHAINILLSHLEHQRFVKLPIDLPRADLEGLATAWGYTVEEANDSYALLLETLNGTAVK